jgi:release factor glutamine methyltransferase
LEYSKTFTFNGLDIEIHSEVYEPAEDTFLLLDSIDVRPRDYFFEIGTGTGIISLDCCRKGADVICSDINPFAVELVKRNFFVNKTKLRGSFEVRLDDLFNVLTFGDKFDIIVFNPPYLPTSDKERVSKWFDKAVDGGEDGLNTTLKFIQELPNYLNKNGSAYFVFSSLSNRDKLEKIIKKID